MFTTRVVLPTLGRVHVLFPNFCINDGLVYIDNRNVEDDCLYQYGLHLLNTGILVSKKVLERNFIFVWNECFPEMHTHQPLVRFRLRKVI